MYERVGGVVEAVAPEEAEQPQEMNPCHAGEIWVVLHLDAAAPVFVPFLVWWWVWATVR
jgi:hypothetical protein